MSAAAALAREHGVRVNAIASAVQSHVRKIALTADPADIDLWWSRVAPSVEALVQRGSVVTADLAARFLAQHAALNGVTLTPQLYAAVAEQVNTALRVTGPVAFKTHIRLGGDELSSVGTMAKRLSASSSRLVLSGSRGTISGAVRDGGIAGYRRVSDGKPCAFCAMLLGRGAVYSADTADFHAHDGDGCSAEPLYEREPEPQNVRDLQDQWAEVTAGKTGSAALRAWSDHWQGTV